MTSRFSLDAQIDAIARAASLVSQNPTRRPKAQAEYDASVLASAVETMNWLRRHHEAIRKAVDGGRP